MLDSIYHRLPSPQKRKKLLNALLQRREECEQVRNYESISISYSVNNKKVGPLSCTRQCLNGTVLIVEVTNHGMKKYV